LVSLIEYLIKDFEDIISFKKIKVEEINNQLIVELSLEITYGLVIKDFVYNFRKSLKEHLENNTGINVKEIDIEIYSLSVD
jgi:uncharacterized alkaline shock family protein YloU